MSIEREEQEIIFCCDLCSSILETGETEFVDAKAQLDKSGWQTRKFKDNWEHYCPNHEPEQTAERDDWS